MYSFLKQIARRFLSEKQKHILRKFLAAKPIENIQTMLGHQPNSVKYISKIDDLDRELAQVDAAFARSDDEGRRAMEQFAFVFDDNLPKDPRSAEYFAAQMKRYRLLSGRDSYSAFANERTSFDFQQIKNAPFPYTTQSPKTVGDQLIAQGFLIREMGLPPHASIVEFGAGWGNTTLHLAQMGYDVTVVEVDKAFVELLHHRVSQIGKAVNIIQQDMLAFEAETKFDAALFFESFHHCSNHLQLLKNLYDIVQEEGLIAFAAEPISEFPFPWGIRLDGFSVWSIRKFGWLELGFDSSYFLRTLLSLGWSPKRHQSNLSQWSDVIIAKKSNLLYAPSEITLPPDESVTWAPAETMAESKIRFTSKRSIMSCIREVDAKAIEFCLSNFAPFDLQVTLETGTTSVKIKIPKHSKKQLYRLPVRDWHGSVTIASSTWNPARVLGNSDRRELGVAVDYFRILC